jgi:3-oxoacyl-[acyl-carrier-protein] synthase II
MNTRVVVTGMGIVSPVGNTIESFWKSVCEGKSGVGPITLWDASNLPSRIGAEVKGLDELGPADFSGKDKRRRDRYTLHAILAADQAWAHSGIDITTEDPERCAVIIGTGIGGIQTLEDGHGGFLADGPRAISPLTIPKLISNMASGEVAIRLGLRGPNKSVVTACASGAQTIIEGVNLIRCDQADVVVAGGAEAPITPFGVAGFCAMKALSRRNEEPQRASRPFDSERDGFVISEGAGIVILESEEHARKRGAAIYGVVAGFGETCDAYHITAPRPDGSGAAGAMRRALASAQMDRSKVHYFNAHGTSTHHNDASETLALKTIFGENMPPVSSTKSMMGHMLGAAGTAEAIVCLLAIEHGVIPPNINYENPDPECQVNLVPNTARDAKIESAMSNSLGFGGHNASLILSRYD